MTNETIVDIIAEMHSYAKRCREENFGVPPACETHYQEDDVEYLADRIDRARKRMEIEMANLRKENAKLREALVTIQNCDINKEEDCHTLYRTCDAALTTTQNTQEDNQ